MNNQSKSLTFWDFTFLWCGASISIAEILSGGYIASLGFKKGVISIILGHLIGTILLVSGGIIGTREKVPSMTSTRISFGSYGTYLFSILNVLQLLGWTAVMIKAASTSLNQISIKLWSMDNPSLWILLIGILIVAWLAFGIKGFKRLNSIAVILLFLLTLVLGWVIFRSDNLLTAPTVSGLSFGGALELSVVMPLSWLPLIADYTRFARSEKEGVLGSFVGYFFGSCWMFIIGLGAAIVSNNPDPSAIMLAANLGVTAFGIVVLSTVTTTFLDAYSAGVTFLNITPKLKEKTVVMIMTVLGTALAIIFPIENYQNFLYAIGSVFAPLFAVLLTDYFIIKKQTKIDSNLMVNMGAILVWLTGVVMYYVFLKFDFVLGATVPSMIITSLLYIISWRYLNKWKLIKK